jgi:hypothetical protein
MVWVALILCLPVSMFLVSRYRPAVSVPLIIIGGQMFLPPVVGFEIPSLTPLNRDILAPTSALIACLILRPQSFAGEWPGRGMDLFIVLRILGYLGSCLTNRDPLIFPRGAVPGLSMYTFLSGSLNMVLYWWPPIFLGRTLIRTSRDLRTLLVILAGAAVVYTFPIFVEKVMSPQFNHWVYGYHPSDFVMAIRNGGYRPTVFMRHGLYLAFFLAISIVAATALGKVGARVFGFKAGLVAIYLTVVLAICNSLGALVYAVAALPLMWFGSVKLQTRVAALIALLAFSYPVARAIGLVPVDQINAFVLEKFGKDRAGSLGLRLSEEEVVMNRATQRVVFGWGGGARSFRLNPITGANESTTDGLWAIEFGQHGAVGFVLTFGMWLYPVWRSRKAISRLPDPHDRALVAALAVMTALFMADLIPNFTLDPYLLFLVAVLGRIVERGLEPEPAPVLYEEAQVGAVAAHLGSR